MRSTAKIVFGASCYNCIGANCYNYNNVQAARTNGCGPLTGLVVTFDRAWETSLIYLSIIWNINGIVQFINTNNKLNVFVDRNNASNTLFTKSDFN